MRTTSLRSAIFPITLSRPSRSQDSSKRDSGSRNSPGPKSSRSQRRFAVSRNLVVEETFRKLEGVSSTAVGYAGGNKENPSYEDVCSDETGHAEVVQVEFDPSQITYDQILDVFWSNHNPTTLNRQGPDVGTQYRSVIFYHSTAQEAAAKASKDRIDTSGRFNRPVVTQIEPAPKFWRAEEYHQCYLQKRGQSQ